MLDALARRGRINRETMSRHFQREWYAQVWLTAES